MNDDNVEEVNKDDDENDEIQNNIEIESIFKNVQIRELLHFRIDSILKLFLVD